MPNRSLAKRFSSPRVILSGIAFLLTATTALAASGTPPSNATSLIVISALTILASAVYIGYYLRHRPKAARASSKIDYRELVESANAIVLLWNSQGDIILINPFGQQCFGHDTETLSGKTQINRLLPDLLGGKTSQEGLLRNIAAQPEFRQESEARRHDGSRLWIAWNHRGIFNRHGELVEIISVGHDITRQKQSLKKLQLAATVFDHSTEGIMITDEQSRILRINPAFTRMTGLQPAQVLGKPPDFLRSTHAPNDFYQQIQHSLQQRGNWAGEVWSRHQDNSIFPCWLSITAVSIHNNTPRHFIGLFTDISDKKVQEKRIAHLAYFDALTELPNRSLFQERLKHALARAERNHNQLLILLLNLDRFKYVNESLGHDAGDQLLKQVAARLLGCVRKTDTVARLGGDEFGIIIDAVKTRSELVTTANHTAQAIIDALRRPLELDGFESFTSVGIGIVSYPDDGQSNSELLKNAYTSLSHAKKSGPNRHLFYKSPMNSAANKRLQMESDMRKGLEQGEFVLYYQPTVNLSDDTISGMEALVRWQHPHLGLVPPLEFIPLAEETGLIIPLGEWVFAEAVRQAKEWEKAGIEPLRMAINLSLHQLREQQLLTFIQRILDEIDLAPERIALELTESCFLADTEQVGRLLHTVAEMGIDLLIDDFGTGYSSLARLKELPARTLKIDRSFIRDLHCNANNVSLVTAIIAMAHNLGLTIIAEGIETQDQYEFMKKQSCEEIQGYFISPPLPAQECGTFFKRKNFINPLTATLLHLPQRPAS